MTETNFSQSDICLCEKVERPDVDFETFYSAFWTWPLEAAYNESIREIIAQHPEYLYKMDSTQAPPPTTKISSFDCCPTSAWLMLRARFDPSTVSIPNALLRQLLYPNGLKHAVDRGHFPLHMACDYGAATGLLAVMAVRHFKSLKTRDDRGRLPLHICVQRLAHDCGHGNNGLVARFHNKCDLETLRLFVALHGGALRQEWCNMTPFVLFCVEGLSSSSTSSASFVSTTTASSLGHRKKENQKTSAAYFLLRESPDVLIQALQQAA